MIIKILQTLPYTVLLENRFGHLTNNAHINQLPLAFLLLHYVVKDTPSVILITHYFCSLLTSRTEQVATPVSGIEGNTNKPALSTQQ